MRKQIVFDPRLSSTRPALIHAMKRKSSFPSPAMLDASREFLSNAIGLQSASLIRNDSFAAAGLARTQNSNWPASLAVTEYSASPGGWFSAKLLIQSPPESWSFLTWSYHQGCR